MYCPNCGNELSDLAKICPNCGHPIKEEEDLSNVSPKSRLAAALLCFFLGWIGAHRFYVGRPVSAILMCITLIVLGLFFGVGVLIVYIWAIIDCILIICGIFKDGSNLPIRRW